MGKPRKFRKVRYPYSEVVSLVSDYAKDKKTILEIGCGTGNNLVFFAENGYDAYGIDMDNKAVKYAKKLLKSKNLEAEIKTGDAVKLPYENKKFDLVLDRGCLQCNRIGTIKRIIKEVERVLKKGGLFMIVNFTSKKDFVAENLREDKTFKNYDYVHFTTIQELKSLLKNFEIIYMMHRKDKELVPRRYSKGTYILVAIKKR